MNKFAPPKVASTQMSDLNNAIATLTQQIQQMNVNNNNRRNNQGYQGNRRNAQQQYQPYQQNNQQAFVQSNQPNYNVQNNNQQQKGNITCFNCGQPGYIRRNCPLITFANNQQNNNLPPVINPTLENNALNNPLPPPANMNNNNIAQNNNTANLQALQLLTQMLQQQETDNGNQSLN